MADDDGVAATMKDLKEMETSLNSNMDKRMDELHNLIAKLASAQASNPSASSVPGGHSSEKPPLDHEGAEGENEPNKEGEGQKEKDKASSSSQGKDGKEEYHTVPPFYSPDPPIPHPHINNIGFPHKIDTCSSFTQWQYLMRNHLRSSCNELWRVVQKGFKPHDPNNLTRREVVDAQLDSTALVILQNAVGPKEIPHIQKFDTAKETWDALEVRFVGNDSMKINRYDELSNEAEGFYMLDGESHEDMYRRLIVIATDFKKVGAEYVDDSWIKRKYVNALMPFEEANLNSIKGREKYHQSDARDMLFQVGHQALQ
jgi:hypothetical protein